MSESSTITTVLRGQFPKAVLAAQRYVGDETAVIARDEVVAVCRFLRDDPRTALDVLMDVSCVDYLKFGRWAANAPSTTTPSPLPYFMPPKPAAEAWERGAGAEYRFDVVYHLYSLSKNHRVRLRVPVKANDAVVDSVTGLWPSANWFEREVWDMFGIRFAGHPDLRRILMYDGFEGHALRKDYPITRRQPIIGANQQ